MSSNNAESEYQSRLEQKVQEIKTKGSEGSGSDRAASPGDSHSRKAHHQRLLDNFRLVSEESNPCLKEHEASMKCLSDNHYLHEKCDNYFENYKYCKNFWNFVRRERRGKGIYPELPTPPERSEVKKEYLPKFKF